MSRLILLVCVMFLSSVVSYSDIIIDNADDVVADWTFVTPQAISANVTAEGEGYGGTGRARQLVYNTDTDNRSAAISTTNNISGNMSSYMNSTIELDYKTLGVGSDGSWTATANFPRYFSVWIQGPGTQAIAADINLQSTGLNWCMDQNWHTISLAIVDGLPSRGDSAFDGVAATTATLSTFTATGGLSASNAETFWANIQYIQVTAFTHLDPDPNNAAILFDNLTLVPEPCTTGLVTSMVWLGMLSFRKYRGMKL